MEYEKVRTEVLGDPIRQKDLFVVIGGFAIFLYGALYAGSEGGALMSIGSAMVAYTFGRIFGQAISVAGIKEHFKLVKRGKE